MFLLPIHWTHRERVALPLFVQRVGTLLTSIGWSLDDSPVPRLCGGAGVICWTRNTIFTERKGCALQHIGWIKASDFQILRDQNDCGTLTKQRRSVAGVVWYLEEEAEKQAGLEVDQTVISLPLWLWCPPLLCGLFLDTLRCNGFIWPVLSGSLHNANY